MYIPLQNKLVSANSHLTILNVNHLTNTNQPLSQRASPTGGAGHAALRNSDGSENGTRFILGFGIGVPLLVLIIGAVWWFRRRRARKRAAAEKASGNPKAKNTGAGKQRRKKSRWGGFGWPDRIKPAPTPNAYRRDKEVW